MSQVYRLPPTLSPQPEGGFTVTSPMLPGLVTEGDTLEEALANVEDALRATLELYEDIGRQVPSGLVQDPDAREIRFNICLPESQQRSVIQREASGIGSGTTTEAALPCCQAGPARI